MTPERSRQVHEVWEKNRESLLDALRRSGSFVRFDATPTRIVTQHPALRPDRDYIDFQLVSYGSEWRVYCGGAVVEQGRWE